MSDETEPRWRVHFTRHSGDEYLQRHLAKRLQRQADAAATPPQQRRRRRNRRLFVAGMVASLAGFGVMGGYAGTVAGDATTRASQLRAEIAALATSSAATPTPSPSGTTTAPAEATDARQRLSQARETAEAAVAVQNRLGQLLYELNSSEDDDDQRPNASNYDSDAMLSTTNELRAKMATLFDSASLTWTDARMYSWASVWAVASQDDDPRLVWSVEGAGGPRGCTWAVHSVSAQSLVAGDGEGVSLLWYCRDRSGSTRAFANASWSEGRLRQFQARQLKI